ncbi:hypothetical protein [Pseudomonas sp. LT1P18]|uniref:hypothetical protein n=1 Tax=Pseudomonas arabinosi TaxID=3398357 RepID=UPI0039EE0C9E
MSRTTEPLEVRRPERPRPNALSLKAGKHQVIKGSDGQIENKTESKKLSRSAMSYQFHPLEVIACTGSK